MRSLVLGIVVLMFIGALAYGGEKKYKKEAGGNISVEETVNATDALAGLQAQKADVEKKLSDLEAWWAKYQENYNRNKAELQAKLAEVNAEIEDVNKAMR